MRRRTFLSTSAIAGLGALTWGAGTLQAKAKIYRSVPSEKLATFLALLGSTRSVADVPAAVQRGYELP